MLSIRNYVRPQTIEEAYEYAKKPLSVVLGGMLWLKMQNRNVNFAIDLSDLHLDQIEEIDDEIHIGAMVTLRELETNEQLNHFTQGAIKESVRHIVGVQFRNLATIGGSIYGRFGFSDVLTLFMALDCEVELYPTGRVSIKEFANMKFTKDILTKVIIKKVPTNVVYFSQRNISTDFPVLTCAVSNINQHYTCIIGARPLHAVAINGDSYFETGITEENIQNFTKCVLSELKLGSNSRASREYRQKIAKVLIERIVQNIEPDLLLIDFVRKNGCYSVKRGCDTSNCGLCTVLLNDKPVLSCSILAMRANGAKVVTLEGMQEEAKPLATFIASQGAEQCGFCNPGFMMNTLALLKENPHPSDDEIKEFLAGNLCRCSGYEGQLRGIKNYLNYLEEKGNE